MIGPRSQRTPWMEESTLRSIVGGGPPELWHAPRQNQHAPLMRHHKIKVTHWWRIASREPGSTQSHESAIISVVLGRTGELLRRRSGRSGPSSVLFRRMDGRSAAGSSGQADQPWADIDPKSNHDPPPPPSSPPRLLPRPRRPLPAASPHRPLQLPRYRPPHRPLPFRTLPPPLGPWPLPPTALSPRLLRPPLRRPPLARGHEVPRSHGPAELG
jgi:hypothetical protein